MEENRMKKVKEKEYFKKYFWDVDIEKLDIDNHKFYIIERLLNFGNEKTLIWLFRNYTKEEIKEVVKKSRSLTIKTARCWQNYFNLKEEEMRCFQHRKYFGM
jgi:hypothetical protein